MVKLQQGYLKSRLPEALSSDSDDAADPQVPAPVVKKANTPAKQPVAV